MMKKNISLCALMMLLSTGFHASDDYLSQNNIKLDAKGKIRLDNFNPQRQALEWSQFLNNSDKLDMDVNSESDDTKLDLQQKGKALIVINSRFSNIDTLLSTKSVDPIAVQEALDTALSGLSEFGNVSELKDNARKAIRVAANDPLAKKDPKKLDQALRIIAQTVKNVLIIPVGVALGAGIGAAAGGAAGAILAVPAGLSAAYNYKGIMPIQESDGLMTRAAKLLPNTLSKVLVGVLSAPSLVVISAIGGAVAGSGVGYYGTQELTKRRNGRRPVSTEEADNDNDIFSNDSADDSTAKTSSAAKPKSWFSLPSLLSSSNQASAENDNDTFSNDSADDSTAKTPSAAKPKYTFSLPSWSTSNQQEMPQPLNNDNDGFTFGGNSQRSSLLQASSLSAANRIGQQTNVAGQVSSAKPTAKPQLPVALKR